MTINQAGSTRRSTVLTASSARKKASENGATDSSRRSISAHRPMGITGERTVKQLRLSKALSAPESTTINEACRRMAARKVDVLLVIDSNAIQCGILTDKDIATRVVARELDLETTNVSAVMTRNPVFVVSDTLAVEALQKMVQGKFRHLSVVENGGLFLFLMYQNVYTMQLHDWRELLKRGKPLQQQLKALRSIGVPLFLVRTHFLKHLESDCSSPPYRP
ncbi:hypothetical protein R6Q57_020861 [Mikania cordata]